MPWVLGLMLLLALPIRAEQPVPRLISDSVEFCTELSERFAALGTEPSTHARFLAQEGRKLCAEGQTRSGIAKLRRALKEAQRG